MSEVEMKNVNQMSFFHSADSMFLEILCHQLEAEGS